MRQSRYISERRGWRTWNRPVKQSRYSWLSGGYMVVMYSQEWWDQKIPLFKSNFLPWRSLPIATQNNRDLNQAILHFRSKFGGPSLNGQWVMVRTSSKWGKLNLTLKVKVNCPPKTIGTLTKVFCIFGPNLVILAWTGPELSRGQASEWHTHTNTWTHIQTQATTIPEGQNWPPVKASLVCCILSIEVCFFLIRSTQPSANI